MGDFLNCLPVGARSQYIAYRNIRDEKDREEYNTKLRDLRGYAAAHGVVRSGAVYQAEWDLKSEFLDKLAMGYVESALEALRLYEVELTTQICACLENTASEFLATQYNMQIQNKGKGVSDVHIPNSAIQALSTRMRNKTFGVMAKVKATIEEARVADVRRRREMSKEQPAPITQHIQHVHQHGDGSVATQSGNVTITNYHYTQNDYQQLTVDLDAIRTALKAQPSTVDTDETIGLLAAAEKAAGKGDESGVKGYLGQIGKAGWETLKSVGVAVGSEVIKGYLRAHGVPV